MKGTRLRSKQSTPQQCHDPPSWEREITEAAIRNRLLDHFGARDLKQIHLPLDLLGGVVHPILDFSGIKLGRGDANSMTNVSIQSFLGSIIISVGQD